MQAAAKNFKAIEALLRRVQESVYLPITDLEIRVWNSPEPLPFSQRSQGNGKPVRIGERWAENLFDCAWIRFSASIPPQYQNSPGLIARIDINGELLIVDRQGEPLRGLTNVKSTFDPTLGGPAKTVYSIPADRPHGGQIELWADAAFNDLFGFIKDDGRIAMAEIALVRESIRQLYYDLETLYDYLKAIVAAQGDNELAHRLEQDLQEAAAALDLQSDSSIEAIRQHLANWFKGNDNVRQQLQIHAIGHAHLDLAWLWPIRETIRKGARTFASALYNIERYPEYIFGASQPQLFAWMKACYPALYERIRQAVKQGRIELQGTFWVEPDCNLPNGESYIRQILHGRAFFAKEFGIIPDYCWEPDVFGYNGQLPQILSKSGHKYFMTQKLSWNVVNRFPLQSFHWQGIDGSSILTHMLPEETYNGPAAARSVLKIADGYAQKEVSTHALMAFGIGDGGGGPDAEHLERLRRAPHLPDMPTVCIEPAANFFHIWETQADAFPEWRGELYLERHQGTLTTQALVKRNNRKTEIAMRELEWAAMLAYTLAHIPLPLEQLDALWKEALLYQFHDILPGSSIKRVYTECNARYEVMLASIRQLTAKHYQAVADALAGSTTHAHQHNLLNGQGDKTAATIAFNSLGWPREQWHKSESGNWQRLQLPAMGWAAIAPANAKTDFSNCVLAETDCLANEHLMVRFAPEGYISSVTDRHTGREFLLAHERSNDFRIITDTGDAWDFETDHPKKDVWPYLRRTAERPTLTSSIAATDGPVASLTQVWSYKNSQIRQQITLAAGAHQIEFDTEANWQEEATMLRVCFTSAITAPLACFEIPFGHIKRSTREHTSEERAQIEVAAQQWVDLSEDRFGLALYNDCKYGFRVKGQTIDMTLLRSVPHPGAPLINKDDSSQSETNNFTDLGTHKFRYALRPHSGPTDAALLTQEARAFNIPPQFVSCTTSTTDRTIATNGSWFVLGRPEIELAAIKPAEDGAGWILRLVNVTDTQVSTTLETSLPVHSFTETDLVEQPLQDENNSAVTQASETTQSIGLSFTPFEIKTLRCTLR